MNLFKVKKNIDYGPGIAFEASPKPLKPTKAEKIKAIQVKAKIVSIGGYSAHADQHMLHAWLKTAPVLPRHTWCMHGEETACAALATSITDTFGIKADVPRFGQTIDVNTLCNL